MKVALVNPRRQRRGGEIFSRRLAEALRRRGHEPVEIYLYPPEVDGGLSEAADEICLDGRERAGLERLAGWDPATTSRLRAATEDADVVQVSGGKTLAYAALSLPRSSARPLLVYRNIGEPGAWFRGRGHRWFYSRWVFPRIDAVATVAESFVSELERSCPNARTVRCIPGGVDFERMAPGASRDAVRAELTTAAEAPVALFAGRLSPEKRVDRLLRVFAAGSASLPEATLWIAGGGALREPLQHQAARLGIDDRVRFLGERSDMGDLLAACDVVTLTSDTEGVPGIAHEAASQGRPVVATRVGATPEAVVDGETGALVDPEDEQGLSRALFELLADPRLRAEMGAAAARAFGPDRVSIEAVAAAYEELYREASPPNGSGVIH